MNGLWKSNRGLFLAVMLILAAAAAVAMRENRSATQQERATKARIETEAKQSIGKATGGLKLCPLSVPDCNNR